MRLQNFSDDFRVVSDLFFLCFFFAEEFACVILLPSGTPDGDRGVEAVL